MNDTIFSIENLQKIGLKCQVTYYRYVSVIPENQIYFPNIDQKINEKFVSLSENWKTSIDVLKENAGAGYLLSKGGLTEVVINHQAYHYNDMSIRGFHQTSFSEEFDKQKSIHCAIEKALKGVSDEFYETIFKMVEYQNLLKIMKY